MFIRDTIYQLKQDYGHRMDLYVPLKAVQDLGTGKQIVDRKQICIKKVVLLSEILQRSLIHDIAFLTAGRNFAYGGLFDQGLRMILIAGTDLPKNIKLNDSCYFIYNHIRYDLVSTEELEHRCGYIIKMKQLNTRPANEVHSIHVTSTIQWTGVTTSD